MLTNLQVSLIMYDLFLPPGFNPTVDEPFRTHSRMGVGVWGRGKKPHIPKICHTYPTIM